MIGPPRSQTLTNAQLGVVQKIVVSAIEHRNVSPVLLDRPAVRKQRTAQGYNFAMTNSTKSVRQDSGKCLHRHGATYQWRVTFTAGTLCQVVRGLSPSPQQKVVNTARNPSCTLSKTVGVSMI